MKEIYRPGDRLHDEGINIYYTIISGPTPDNKYLCDVEYDGGHDFTLTMTREKDNRQCEGRAFLDLDDTLGEILGDNIEEFFDDEEDFDDDEDDGGLDFNFSGRIYIDADLLTGTKKSN